MDASEDGRGGWYSWAVVVMCTLITGICTGSKSLIPLLVVDWESTYGLTRDHVSGIVALLHIMHGISTPIAGGGVWK